MAFYLVRAQLRDDLKEELASKLENEDFRHLRPFGKALSFSLENARIDPDTGEAVWEEEDYCTPPLAEEQAAVLDHYFENLAVEPINKGEGWKKIREYPLLWE